MKRTKPQLAVRHDVKQEIIAIRRAAAKATASPEASREFLYRAGILTKSGQLKKQYRSD